MMIKETYPVAANDMTAAGDVSARIKRHMKQLGIPASVMRRVAVGTYEAEINLVIHSEGGLTLKLRLRAFSSALWTWARAFPTLKRR